MDCPHKTMGVHGELTCNLDDECTYPKCEDEFLNPVSFPLSPPTMHGTDISKDVGLS
jgi:hypothetical protein